MKRRIIILLLLCIITALMISNTYLEITQDTSIFEFAQRTQRLSEQDREWLADHGPLIYGADNNSPPLRFFDAATGQYSGIVVDYLSALSIEIGVEITFVPLVWDDALQALERGETDICDMYPSEERARKYLFTDPIYNQKGVIVVPKDETDIMGYEDLDGRTIAAQRGDYVYDFLSPKIPRAVFTFTPDYLEALYLLRDGKVEAVVGDEPVLSYFLSELGIADRFKILDREIYEMESIFSVPKSQKELVRILNYGISVLKKKDTMAKIHQKWFGISAPFIKENTTERYMHIGLLALYLLVLSAYVFNSWNHQLKREVERRTKQLHNSQNELETTFNGLIHLMIVIDEHYRIVNVNTSFCRVMNKTRDQLIGVNIRQFPDLLYSPEHEIHLTSTFARGTISQMTVVFHEKVYDLSLLPLKDDETDTIHRALIMVKDVTQIRIAEQEILQSNKMSAIGHLAAGVAHEMRNPLGLIRNYCYVLKKDDGIDRKKFDQALEVIDDSVERASTIIKNLLEFSRISDDQAELVDLHELLTNIFTLEYNHILKHHIHIELQCEPGKSCTLNRESYKHIIINCISNAIDAMPDGGRLGIVVDLDELTLTTIITDTGMGIREADIEKIFNTFFTTKRPGEGTGLGLYITYNEIKKLGGDIRVESKVGEGTRFTITLPVVVENEV